MELTDSRVMISPRAHQAHGGRPRQSLSAWLLCHLGPPPQPPRRYFSKCWSQPAPHLTAPHQPAPHAPAPVARH